MAVFLRIWVARSTTNLETVASLGDDEKKVRAKFEQVCGHLRHLSSGAGPRSEHPGPIKLIACLHARNHKLEDPIVLKLCALLLAMHLQNLIFMSLGVWVRSSLARFSS